MSQAKSPRTTDGERSSPKYVEVRKRLLEELHSGAFTSDHTLPKERDLAISLEVSRGTLRQALRGLEREGLIRRIRGKGTFVNSDQQRRAQVKTNVFSLITPALFHDLYPALIEGAEKEAVRTGHRLMTSNSNNELSRQEELLRKAAEANVDGVMLVPATQLAAPRLGTPDQIRPLRQRHIPIVFCHRRIQGVAAPLVTWPFVDVGRLAAEILVTHGHRRIVSVPYMEEVFVEAAGIGLREVMRDHGVDPSGYRVIAHGDRLGGEHTRIAIRKALENALSASQRPTAILCFNSFDAEQVYLLAGELGYRIPKDLSLAYFGARQRPGALTQRITCVAVDECEIGERACGLLEDINSGLISQDSNQTSEVSLVLLPGETVGPPAK